jgi:hypothetical protein
MTDAGTVLPRGAIAVASLIVGLVVAPACGPAPRADAPAGGHPGPSAVAAEARGGPPAPSAAPPSATDSRPPATPQPPPPAAAPDPAASPVIVLEHQPCRTARPAYRLLVALDGKVELVALANLPFSSKAWAIDPEAVRHLFDEATRSGIERMGHGRCTPTADRRCSMHPCATSLAISQGGVMHVTSSTDDAEPLPARVALIAEVEKVTRAWQWVDPAIEASAAGPCASEHDCTVIADRCGGLHASLVGKTVDPPAPQTCSASSRPKEKVEPLCVDARCVLAPVNADTRRCQADAQCTAVRVGCDGVGAVRKDAVRQIAVRNDHLQCPGPAAPLPAAACLRGVCVTRRAR